MNGENVVARANERHEIPDRRFVGNASKAQRLSAEALGNVKDTHIRMSREIQQDFGLRREESIEFVPSYADGGDRLVLNDSWIKGGRGREIPSRTDAQRQVLARAHHVAGRCLLIPANRNYVQQLRTDGGHTSRAGCLRFAPASTSLRDVSNRGSHHGVQTPQIIKARTRRALVIWRARKD